MREETTTQRRGFWAISQKTSLQVTAPMRAAKKEESLRRPKLAVPSHLFKMNQLKAS